MPSGRVVPQSRKRFVEEAPADAELAEAEGKRKPAHFGKVDNNEVETPDNVMHEIRKEWPDFFDPCPFVGKGRLPDFDGKSIEWHDVNYVNPPYNSVEDWFEKAILEARKGRTSVFLVPGRTGRRYWERYVYPYADELRWITGIVIFKGYTEPSPHGLVMIVYRPGHRIFDAPPPLITPPRNMDRFDPRPLLTNLAMKAKFPELYHVCSAVAQSHPVLSGPELKRMVHWRGVTCTLLELLNPSVSVARGLRTVCLPLFRQIVRCEERYCGGERDIQETFATRGELDAHATRPLTHWLYHWKSVIFVNPSVARELCGSTTETRDDKWYAEAVGFYRAYMETASAERGRVTRTYHKKVSDDGRFTQHVTYL